MPDTLIIEKLNSDTIKYTITNRRIRTSSSKCLKNQTHYNSLWSFDIKLIIFNIIKLVLISFTILTIYLRYIARVSDLINQLTILNTNTNIYINIKFINSIFQKVSTLSCFWIFLWSLFVLWFSIKRLYRCMFFITILFFIICWACLTNDINR